MNDLIDVFVLLMIVGITATILIAALSLAIMIFISVLDVLEDRKKRKGGR